MKSNNRQHRIDLGTASKATLGAKGYSTDLVREIPSVTGISNR